MENTPVNTESNARRSARSRRPVEPPKPSKPRTVQKRTLAQIEDQEEQAARKKHKAEDRKAVTDALNVRRAELEAARKRWMYHHRDLFKPLTRSNNVFFENIESDSKAHGAYVPMEQVNEQPRLVEGGEMKDYQLEGLSFMLWMHRNGMNSVLGDEMGLGKTLQTLALFALVKEHSAGITLDPHLIVCPLSVLSSWHAEAGRWVPSMKVLRFHGTASERERLKSTMKGNSAPHYDIILTTYDVYAAEDRWLKTRRWTYVVLDEGHKIKNSETNLSGKLQGLGSLYRLILTGTPLQNTLSELWGLLNWLYPVVFTPATERFFQRSYDYAKGNYDLDVLKLAQKLLAVIMLRRTKNTIQLGVPPREEMTVFIPLTEAQRFWTYRMLTKMDDVDLNEVFTAKNVKAEVKVQKTEASSKLGITTEPTATTVVQQSVQTTIRAPVPQRSGTWKKLMNLLLQLRQICNHPYMLGEDAEPSPYYIGEHLVSSSSKLIAIDKILMDILPKGERVLIFSQWTSMLDLLEDFMHLRKIKYCRLDGSTPRARRTLDIKLFQQENSPFEVYLISTKAGGLGINLTKASCVIMCDSDWNPQNDLQAMARAHRIGQTKIVKVYRLICRATVEDQMLDRLRRKLFLSVKVMGLANQSASQADTGLGYDEVMNILRKGSSALMSSDDGMNLERFLEADIESICKVSREQEKRRDAKVRHELGDVGDTKQEVDEAANQRLLQDAEEEEKRLLSGVAQVQSRLFEGHIIARRDEKPVQEKWIDLQKRARSDRTVTVGGMTFILDAPEVYSMQPASPKKKPKKVLEHEDWCIVCRDGGELYVCDHCPRVFHRECLGLSVRDTKMPSIRCPQHSCCCCARTLAQSGGLLFRCQTCPQAFCEDCLHPGPLDAVGDNLPEFELLGYPEKSSAYYIRCIDCHEHWEQEPKAWKGWKAEMRDTEKKLRAREMGKEEH